VKRGERTGGAAGKDVGLRRPWQATVRARAAKGQDRGCSAFLCARPCSVHGQSKAFRTSSVACRAHAETVTVERLRIRGARLRA
jgi:hypothetical protein